MTAIELREELFREMNPLLDSESAMKKILSYVSLPLLPAKVGQLRLKRRMLLAKTSL